MLKEWLKITNQLIRSNHLENAQGQRGENIMDTQTVIELNKYESKILELVENQLRNDDNSLTQSDLQGAISAVIHNAFYYGVGKGARSIK